MHTSVLPEEVIELLDLHPGNNIIDCTAGTGGHTFQIAKHIQPKGKVLALDWDSKTAKELTQKIHEKNLQKRILVIEENFANIQRIVEKEKFQPVHGILFDLGFSSNQLESRGRGFSFQKSEPLDMRYSESNPTTAEKIVQYQSKAELEYILQQYGEEQFAKHIAKAIIQTRAQKPITTTEDLVSVIKKATPKSYQRKKIHPATKTFQALRIAVNDELSNIKQALQHAEQIIEPNGRIAVISFHSLEDRIVKEFFRDTHSLQPIHKKPIEASASEIKRNPRARSAKLRVAQKQ
jgi:16S rRNA (cytosine1402-N4)-methyltransferase